MKLKVLITAASMIATILAASSHAHFLWLVPTDESGSKVSLYFGEGPEPENPALLKKLASVQAVPFRNNKPEKPQAFQFEQQETKLAAEYVGATAWTLSHTYGTVGRDEKSLLVYNANSVACRRPGMDASDSIAIPKVGCTAEPTFDGETLTVQIWYDEKPASEIDVELQSPNDHQSLKTDKQGVFRVKVSGPSVYAIRCLQTEDKSGRHDGVEYKSIKKYTTVSFMVPKLSKYTVEESIKIGALPKAITSFGATVIDGSIYAYGGHTGGAHSYSLDEQFNTLIRMSPDSNKDWEVITEGPRVQGNALVAHDANVILVGGFTAENAKGEASRLVSKAIVQKFDLKTRQWIELPQLPEPRSSMDATVLDGNLYALGGWTMSGDSDTKWLKTAWRLPLNDANAKWQPIAEPTFQRRALAVVAHAGRVFAIGGMNESGEPTTQTDAYNPIDNTWKRLGSIAGVPMNGFGVAATDINGKLIASAVDGSIQEFDDEMGIWKTVGHVTTGRFFHRMLPMSKDRVAIFGGANMQVGKFREAIILSAHN